VILHSYGGSVEVARQFLDYHAYFSFSGALTRTRNQRLPEVAKFLPRDRVLIETDSPDLLPQALWQSDPDRPNEPAFLTEILNRLAELWESSTEDTARTLEENTRRLTRLYFPSAGD
jgi:TatD DNase family protein